VCEPSHFGEKVSSLLTHDGENATGNAAFETDVFSEPLPGQLYTPAPGGEFRVSEITQQ
jgi:hypothetical protein